MNTRGINPSIAGAKLLKQETLSQKEVPFETAPMSILNRNNSFAFSTYM